MRGVGAVLKFFSVCDAPLRNTVLIPIIIDFWLKIYAVRRSRNKLSVD